jgi:anti-sigma-K factor RskA
MSDNGSTSGAGPRDIDTDNLSGAYALNALSDEERHAFEARIRESDEIRTEVAELNETALLLGRAVEPVQPSAGLRSSIMDLLDSTPQLPKLETQDHAPSIGKATHRAAPADAMGEILEPIPLARQRWFMRPAVLLVGAAAAVGLFFGGGAAFNSLQPNDPGTSIAAGPSMSQILAASDVQHTVSDVTTGGKATLYWSNDLQRSAVILDGVTSLPSDKTYQLWYISGSHIASAGTVKATSNNVSQVLQGDMKKGETVGITVEPDGGSKQPTSKPIVAIQSA